MKLRSRMTGTALVLTLSTFGLAACGGSDSSSDDSNAKDTTSKTEAAPEATEDAATEAAPETNSGDKPSKDDVVDGYSKLIGDMLGETEMPAGILDKVVTCFVDEVYDDASAKTLNAIADGNQAGIDPADANLFTEAGTACQAKVAG